MDAERWVSVGHSDLADAREAGRSAARAALEHDDPKLLTVFCSDSYELGQLLGGIHDVAGDDVPLIGCSTAGVVITALGGAGFEVTTAVATDASANLRGAGATAASCIAGPNGHANRVLLMLTDGLAGDQQEIVRGAYGIAGAAIPLVGGCAGDDLRMEATHQLYGDRVLTDTVVAASLSSDAPFGIGVCHGWRRVGDPMLVTDSEGTRVLEIDGRPALDVYLEKLGAPEAAFTDHAAFTEFAQTHPLGLIARRGEEHVRFIGDADFEARALLGIAQVPQGARVWFMEGDDDSVLDATDAACREALAGLGGQEPIGLLAFDCIARRGILGDEGIQAEINRVAECAHGAPVAGFYTYGEIARTRGVAGFHNQTLVVLAVG